MKDIFKTLMMLFILGSPIAIVFFLKMFGSNKFDLPVFHASGYEWQISECSNKEVQHLVSYPLEISDYIKNSSRAIVVGHLQSERNVINNLLRIHNSIDSTKSQLILIHNTDISDPNIPNELKVLQLQSQSIFDIRCELLLRHKNEFVLIDESQQIRGYYDLSEEEEAERLMVEIKILFYE